MKKLLIILSLLFSLVLLSSCANKNIKTNEQNLSSKDSNSVNTEDTKSTSQETRLRTIKDYNSYKENTRYVYEGKGNEYASYNVLVDYISESRVQIRYFSGTETVKVLETKDGELTELLSRGGCDYRENLTQTPSSNVEILLKEPLTKGTIWTLSDGRKRYISNVDVEVTTPSGKYKAIEVTTEGKEDMIATYYAPNVGLVKTLYTSKGLEVSSTLARLETNVPLIQTVKFYYPNVVEDKIYFVTRQLSFKTNDIVKTTFENTFKDLPKGNLAIVKVLGPNARIKSLYLNKDNMVYVDFTKEFVSEMNAGTGYEGMILQCITNTLGTYYGVDKVYLTIEGSPYASGHIVKKKGEFFTVNLKKCVELK